MLLIAACDGDVEPEGPVSLNTPSYFGPYAIPENNPTTHEGVRLGRALFYEKRLSGDQSMSCANCHQQAYAFTDGNQFSKGIDGIEGSFNSMSLQNLLWSERFFWNGRATSLEDQALKPIEDPIELHLPLSEAVARLQADGAYEKMFKQAFGDKKVTADRIAMAIAQFERTLISNNSRYDKFLRNEGDLSDLELQGLELFFTHPTPTAGIRGGNCGDCHLGPRTSGAMPGFDGFHNNGLDDQTSIKLGLSEITGEANDVGKFKAPTLRNIALTAPYMHDGRFQSLEEVLDHYNDHIKWSETLDPLIRSASNLTDYPPQEIKLGLSENEKTAIIAFLNTLTDTSFIHNPAFSSPFEE